MKKKDVNICICNTSVSDITEAMEGFNFKYYYSTLQIAPYCKPVTINWGVKHLVRSEYFILSDIDIIYPPTYIEEMKKLIEKNKDKEPIRVITYNRCLSLCEKEITYNDCKYSTDKNNSDGLRGHGFAAGIGLVHLDSFNRIGGFDHQYIGYGPEDADFNFRIEFINKLLEIDDPKVNTYHMYHEYEHDKSKTYSRNVKICVEKKAFIKEVLKGKHFDPLKHMNLIIANPVNYIEPKRYDFNINQNSLVVNIGGYKGEWADLIYKKYFCKLIIFEPVKAFCEETNSKYIANQNVRVLPWAIEDENKRGIIYINGDASSIYNSSHKRQEVDIKENKLFIKSFPSCFLFLGSPLNMQLPT